jgi:hypothetical protein
MSKTYRDIVANPHPTVPVVIDGETVRVDIDIAELVDLLNRAGFRTVESCQKDDDGYVFLAFASTRDLVGFMNLAASEPGTGKDTLWSRIDRADGVDPGHLWSYWAFPSDRATEWVHEGQGVRLQRVGPPDFEFEIMLTFPRSDIAALVDLLRQRVANDGRAT